MVGDVGNLREPYGTTADYQFTHVVNDLEAYPTEVRLRNTSKGEVSNLT